MSTQKAYEYIIIGAGSAGCVMANRLSADENNRVLLIEAGGPSRNPLMNIPGAYIKLFRTNIDWQYWTAPQVNANNRKIYLPRGKVLGGSSSTNAMAYVRGNRNDYDHWASLGNRGWNYDAVLPFFKKSECNAQVSELDEGYHGSDGPLGVTFNQKFNTPYAKAFIQAGERIGLPICQDYNGENQEGIGRLQFTIKNGKRHNSFSAFVKPIKNRFNLTLMPNTTIKRILFEQQTAIGVETVSGEKYTATKEVILSAGAFNSPQVLMLSGIGPAAELKKHNIPVLLDRTEVGENLQDHLLFPVSAISKTKSGLNHHASLFGQLKGLFQYIFGRSGPYTISPLEATAFFNIDDFSKRANFQFHFAPMHIGSSYDYDMYDINSYPYDVDGFSIMPSLLNPESRGQVTLMSSNPTEHPLIDPNFLSAPEDMRQLVKGGEIAWDMMHQEVMEEWREKMVLPEKKPDTQEWEEHIRKTVETIYHPVGTCRMGVDDNAVVDDQLRVNGVQNLRVVDASIMPKIVTGNTNAAVYMIAEKAADMIVNPATQTSPA